MIALYLLNKAPEGIYKQHLDNAKSMGLLKYLRMDNFIHRNTDGPLNPYAKVYDVELVKKDFQNFTVLRSYKQFMDAPPLPVKFLPFERILGWHLWVHMSKKKEFLFENLLQKKKFEV